MKSRPDPVGTDQEPQPVTGQGPPPMTAPGGPLPSSARPWPSSPPVRHAHVGSAADEDRLRAPVKVCEHVQPPSVAERHGGNVSVLERGVDNSQPYQRQHGFAHCRRRPPEHPDPVTSDPPSRPEAQRPSVAGKGQPSLPTRDRNDRQWECVAQPLLIVEACAHSGSVSALQTRSRAHLDALSPPRRHCGASAFGQSRPTSRTWGSAAANVNPLRAIQRDVLVHPGCPIQPVRDVGQRRERRSPESGTTCARGVINVRLWPTLTGPPLWADVSLPAAGGPARLTRCLRPPDVTSRSAG